jgi:hypothetical protein
MQTQGSPGPDVLENSLNQTLNNYVNNIQQINTDNKQCIYIYIHTHTHEQFPYSRKKEKHTGSKVTSSIRNFKALPSFFFL